HHRALRRRALHVRVELPGGPGKLQLHRAVELVQAAGRALPGEGPGRAVPRHGDACLSARRLSLSDHEFPAHLEISAATARVPLPDLTLPESRHLLLGRMRFHYLDRGSRGLPPVVFLPRGGLSAPTWDIVCAARRRERHCVALDQRGHGESEWSPEM